VRLLWSIGFIVLLLNLTACRPDPLAKALRGKFPPEKNNEVITEYCQSCHIHRDFDPSGHAPRMQNLYDRLPYTATTECRTCHLVRDDTWGVKQRKTLWPALVAQKRQK
jgi:hypothetical protein